MAFFMTAKPRLTEEERAPLYIYGLHSAAEALGNPARTIEAVYATENALTRLSADMTRFEDRLELTGPKKLTRLVGEEAVHQGIVVKARPLEPVHIGAFDSARLLVALDQVTDPHNVGAIIRSAAAFGADGLMMTWRNAPPETGVLVKSASGAFDHVPIARVTNLGSGLTALKKKGFDLVGLAGEGDLPIEEALGGQDRVCIVMGAEGKGLREKTRNIVDTLARIEMAGAISALNVSNAAAVALFLASRGKA